MANFDDFKKKAKDAVGAITDVSVEAYKLAEEKAKAVAKKARLNSEISREKSMIRRLHTEMGRVYYELYKDNPEEVFVQNCTEIASAIERIAERQRELDEMTKNDDFNAADEEE